MKRGAQGYGQASSLMVCVLCLPGEKKAAIKGRKSVDIGAGQRAPSIEMNRLETEFSAPGAAARLRDARLGLRCRAHTTLTEHPNACVRQEAKAAAAHEKQRRGKQLFCLAALRGRCLVDCFFLYNGYRHRFPLRPPAPAQVMFTHATHHPQRPSSHPHPVQAPPHPRASGEEKQRKFLWKREPKGFAREQKGFAIRERGA